MVILALLVNYYQWFLWKDKNVNYISNVLPQHIRVSAGISSTSSNNIRRNASNIVSTPSSTNNLLFSAFDLTHTAASESYDNGQTENELTAAATIESNN